MVMIAPGIEMLGFHLKKPSDTPENLDHPLFLNAACRTCMIWEKPLLKHRKL
jgi:hypothetical protein